MLIARSYGIPRCTLRFRGRTPERYRCYFKQDNRQSRSSVSRWKSPDSGASNVNPDEFLPSVGGRAGVPGHFTAVFCTMERARRETPSKMQRRDVPTASSPRSHTTPVKQNEIRPRRTAYQNNAGCLTVLPSHITPPSGLTIVRRNPFEADLTSRLHLSMISPNVFDKAAASPSQQSPDFKWSIDELAHIRPAKIEESVVQQVCSPDPEVEMRAQQAIDRFFKENQIIPSPWEIRERDNRIDANMDTPVSRPLENLNSSKEFLKTKRDAWSQTVLSLPMDLPRNVEDVLKSFFTFTQEQTADNDDVNSSNNSLRRKLFFNHDECTDHDNESCVSSSSVEMSGSMMLSCSPPQSGMFIRGTLKGSLQIKRQSNGSESLSPPYVSPIKNDEGKKLYKRLGSFSQWDAQSDHITNMSVEDVNLEERQNSNDNDALDVSCDTNDVRRIEDNCKLTAVNSDKLNVCDAIGMEMLSKCANSVDDATHSMLLGNKYLSAANLEIATEVREESSTHKNPKQDNTMFGAIDSQNISNSVQDTGYQTCSTNSMMHTVDSCNHASIDYKLHSGEQIVTFTDDTQLSWRENMTNVFSSTPSKCNKEK